MGLSAKSVLKRRRVTGVGLESTLDTASVFTLILGALSAIGLISFLGISGIPLGVLVTLGALLIWLLLRSLAEGIRLLKRAAGLEFDGRISGSHYDMVPTCGNCGSMLHSDVCCDGCGARMLRPEIDDDDTTDGSA